MTLELNKIYCGDCLDLMREMPDKSVDLVLTDPPYGTTQNKWDDKINLELIWPEFKRVGKEDCVYVFTASQPFTTDLINSNRQWFKYEWIWNKSGGGNFLNANRTPLKIHENILVFSQNAARYTPQKQIGKPRFKGGKKYANNGCYGDYNEVAAVKYNEYFPKSIIEISNTSQGEKEHSTQKPLALMEYLIQTYSSVCDTVLDPFMGSGTTCVACKKLGRNFIGIEKEPAYVAIAEKRLEKVNNHKLTDFFNGGE